jgi:hypothetical protein
MIISDFNHSWHSSLHENLPNPEVLSASQNGTQAKVCMSYLADLKSCEPYNSHFALQNCCLCFRFKMILLNYISTFKVLIHDLKTWIFQLLKLTLKIHTHLEHKGAYVQILCSLRYMGSSLFMSHTCLPAHINPHFSWNGHKNSLHFHRSYPKSIYLPSEMVSVS